MQKDSWRRRSACRAGWRMPRRCSGEAARGRGRRRPAPRGCCSTPLQRLRSRRCWRLSRCRTSARRPLRGRGGSIRALRSSASCLTPRDGVPPLAARRRRALHRAELSPPICADEAGKSRCWAVSGTSGGAAVSVGRAGSGSGARGWPRRACTGGSSGGSLHKANSARSWSPVGPPPNFGKWPLKRAKTRSRSATAKITYF